MRVPRWSRSSRCPGRSAPPDSAGRASARIFGQTYRRRTSHGNADTPSTTGRIVLAGRAKQPRARKPEDAVERPSVITARASHLLLRGNQILDQLPSCIGEFVSPSHVDLQPIMAAIPPVLTFRTDSRFLANSAYRDSSPIGEEEYPIAHICKPSKAKKIRRRAPLNRARVYQSNPRTSRRCACSQRPVLTSTATGPTAVEPRRRSK